MELLGVDLEGLNTDMETYQENWAGISLQSQKLLSRGPAEKLGNTVFKVYTLSIKIKALKFVDLNHSFYYCLLTQFLFLFFGSVAHVPPILSSYNLPFILFRWNDKTDERLVKWNFLTWSSFFIRCLFLLDWDFHK